MIEAILPDLLLIFVSALICGWVAYRLRLPLVLGYVTAGIAVGPYTAGPTITQLPLVETLAEIGVALMLFMLGLELSLKDTKAVRTFAWLGTPLQMLLTMAYGVGITLWFGWSWVAAFWFGAMLSLSGVMITLRELKRLKLTDIQAARLSIGMLTVQNLLVIPLILVLDKVVQQEEGLQGIAMALVQGLLLLALLLLLGSHAIPRLVAYLGAHSAETQSHVMLACAILISIGIYWAGVPFVFAAFAIGIAFSESKSLESLLRPLLFGRPLFGMLFFVSVGVLLDLPLILANLGPILVTVVWVMIGKGLLLVWLVRSFGYSGKTPLIVGLTLWQVSELSLVLSRLGADVNVLDATLYTFTVTTILLTLLVAPLVSNAVIPAIHRKQQNGIWH